MTILAGVTAAAPLALVNRLFDKGISGGSEKDILYAACSMIWLAVMGGFLIYLSTIFSGRISTGIYRDVINDMYMKIQSLDLKFFTEIKVGDSSYFRKDTTYGMVFTDFQKKLKERGNCEELSNILVPFLKGNSLRYVWLWK